MIKIFCILTIPASEVMLRPPSVLDSAWRPVPIGQCLILTGRGYDVPTVKYFDHNAG